MINLSDTQIIDYGDEYYNLVLPKIMPKYRALNHNLKNKLSGDRMIDFISGSNETEFKIFLKDLLTEKIDFLKIKYPQLAIYMYTADFLESTVSEVKKILIGISPSDKHSRTLARETYISEVIFKGGNNSIWIKELNNKRLNKNLLLTSEEKLKKFLKIIKIYFGRLNIFLKNVIDYSHISGEIRKNVLLNFGIEVCPYCNRNYISKFKKMGK
ncbi:hypothetical protein MKY22_08640 [Exiguobacterium sp. FSL W8-0210]|uniref:hypothetical protein n=1 Tax=Exiguobacterium sp. FSL W8-0210 TaxID=2921598 RepID=UPI0030FB9BE2